MKPARFLTNQRDFGQPDVDATPCPAVDRLSEFELPLYDQIGHAAHTMATSGEDKVFYYLQLLP